MKDVFQTRVAPVPRRATQARRASIAECQMLDAARLSEEVRRLNPRCLQVRVLPDGTLAMLQNLLFTRSIALGCHRDGWAKRFCFEDRALADKRFAEIQSEDDVPDGYVASRVVVPIP